MYVCICIYIYMYIYIYTYSELLKLNDFNEMSVPAARTQLLKLTDVASSLCLENYFLQFVDFSPGFCIALDLV